MEEVFSFCLSVSTLNGTCYPPSHQPLGYKLTQSYWSQGSPVTAWGFHQPLTLIILFPRAAPTSPRSDIIPLESMPRINPLFCCQMQQNRRAGASRFHRPWFHRPWIPVHSEERAHPGTPAGTTNDQHLSRERSGHSKEKLIHLCLFPAGFTLFYSTDFNVLNCRSVKPK